jgi:hypothetical protein
MVTRHQDVAFEVFEPVEEPVELDRPIALDARVGCPTRHIVGDEAINDTVSKLRRVVQHVVGDIELARHPAGVLGIGDRATAGGRCLAIGPGPHLESDSDHIMTGVAHQSRRHRRVDTA